MMTNRILTICAVVSAALAVEAVGALPALAQGYPPPGAVYSPYPPARYPTDYRGAPRPQEYDVLDDDDGPNGGPGSTALPPPGPVLSPNDPRYSGRPVYPDQGPIQSPDDPRYGRPTGPPPTYSDRGPVMSPDDPRYGRAAPPPVIYADRPGGPLPQPPYDPADDYGRGSRPPGAVGSGNVTGSVQPPQGAAPQGPENRTASLLPPEEQPDAAPVNLPPNLRRQEVNFVTKEPAGTLIVDTPNTYLYYVLGNNRAIRYGVRVGRDGFTWNGVQKISRKAEWPDWHPPTEMIERQPYLPRFMAGGPGNPLGARAMYLGSTVYRIYGTNQPSTIGKFVSSGCIGMLNEDVSDLFDRVKVGTRVVVMPGNPPAALASAQAVPGPNAGPNGGPAYSGPSGPVPGGVQPTVVPPLPAPVTV